MKSTHREIVIATGNPGKLREIAQVLSGLPVNVIGLNAIADIAEPEETGATFAQNAREKALYYAQATERWCLADDSGLQVDALGGAPGIHSARYSSDTVAPNSDRSAVDRANGTFEGVIARLGAGDNGFGYDPLFYVPDHDCTAAELPPEEKNRISHRGQAVRRFAEMLTDYMAAEAC